MRSIQNNTLILDALRATGAFLFFPKGALTHHLQSRRWYPSLRSGSCALHELSFSHFSRGGRQCRKRTFPVQSALCFVQSAKRWGCILPPHPAVCLRKPATGSFIADMDGFSPPIFFLRKRNKKPRAKGR